MNRCLICDQIIKAGEEQPDGKFDYHRICFDIAVANLAEEISTAVRSRPDLYKELPNGNFRSIHV